MRGGKGGNNSGNSWNWAENVGKTTVETLIWKILEAKILRHFCQKTAEKWLRSKMTPTHQKKKK
jgi:hypothetical protein